MCFLNECPGIKVHLSNQNRIHYINDVLMISFFYKYNQGIFYSCDQLLIELSKELVFEDGNKEIML